MDIKKVFEKDLKETKVKLKKVRLNDKELSSIVKKELKEPILLLIRGNGEVDLFDNVDVGKLKIKRVDGQEGLLLLHPSKMLSIKLGKRDYKGWIAYEYEALPYPLDVKKDNHILYNFINSIINNYKSFEAKAKEETGKAIMYILIGLAVVLAVYLLFKGSGEKVIVKEVVSNAGDVAKQLTQNASVIK